jgi:hypothetical protein
MNSSRWHHEMERFETHLCNLLSTARCVCSLADAASAFCRQGQNLNECSKGISMSNDEHPASGCHLKLQQLQRSRSETLPTSPLEHGGGADLGNDTVDPKAMHPRSHFYKTFSASPRPKLQVSNVML